ncbi:MULTISPECIES: lipoprotein signal peptidase [Prevotella]|uniref:lipoprotein signal peptidase n=1 Tax=Prevotella TaxID=838 RepID=UPI000D0ED628|nr:MULTISPECIES: lipoprotein signal peptidase [Prevotella]MEE0670335.1 lipoprotein signal peptidase [Prevotella sp.]
MKQTTKTVGMGWIAVIIIAAILIVDQIIKIEVKTNMSLGEALRITDWFYIEFIENNGMAYGMTFINKLVLSLFRMFAICGIGWYIWRVVKSGLFSKGYIVCLSMVLAGAAGNLIDCLFYGLIFNASTPFNVAHFVPFGEGYSTFLHGRVVDMFYFPIIHTQWPDWVPVWGGDDFVFFSPVFNFADSCISVGVVLLLLFFRKDLERMSLAWKK